MRLSGAAVGIGWRQPHYAELLERRPALGFLEVHAENFFADGGASLAVLDAAREHYPISLHGVGLGLGSNAGLDPWHLDRLARLCERVGHVFEGNLMVADNAPVAGRWSPPRLALLRFEQPPMLCGKVTAPMSSKVDGNVYVRMGAAEAANRPLVSWAAVADANCMSFFDTLDDFRKAVPGVEAKARVFINHSGAVFRSPEMRRFEPVGLLAAVPAQPVPAEARKVLGWPDVPHVPGAYPASR